MQKKKNITALLCACLLVLGMVPTWAETTLELDTPEETAPVRFESALGYAFSYDPAVLQPVDEEIEGTDIFRQSDGSTVEIELRITAEGVEEDAEQRLLDAGFDGIIGINTEDAFAEGIEAIGFIGLNAADQLGREYTLTGPDGAVLYIHLTCPQDDTDGLQSRLMDMVHTIAFTAG